MCCKHMKYILPYLNTKSQYSTLDFAVGVTEQKMTVNRNVTKNM